MKGTIKEIIDYLKDNFQEDSIACMKVWTVEDIQTEFAIDETVAEEMLERAEIEYDPSVGINLEVLDNILCEIKDKMLDDIEETDADEYE